MRLVLLLLLAGMLPANGSSQDVRLGTDYSLLLSSESPTWGNDVLISPTEPLGRPSGVARPNGTVYVSVPDTSITPGFGLRVFHSTDFGRTWSMIPTGIMPAIEIAKTKMILTGQDSIFCVFQTGTAIYVWNVESNNFNLFTGEAARDFDINSSSTGALYLWVDVASNNTIRRYSSITGGSAWINPATVTSAGAHPRVYMGTRDTLVLNYYGPVLADTTRSIIRAARYRQTGHGTVASINFQDVTTEAIPKPQFGSVIHENIVWFFYTAVNSPGTMDIKSRVSTNAGLNYGTAFTAAGDTAADEFWWDARHWEGGVDLIYYTDSLGVSAGQAPEGVVWSSADLSVPESFSPPERFSDRRPAYSTRDYIPTLVGFYDPGTDIGALWVGMDGSSARVYWDRLTESPSGVVTAGDGIPETYRLDQNYPNPFNPSTTIRFALPRSEEVAIKVYDVLGKEVATLVSGHLHAGSYVVTFDGSRFSSGVYFYHLRTPSFVDTRKMMLVK